MNLDLRAHVTFHLAGWQAGATADTADLAGARPAVLGRYRNLASLRYDFPVVLLDAGGAEALSAVVDAALGRIAGGGDATRVIHHALRLEQRIRELAAAGAAGTLFELWDMAAAQLLDDRDALLEDSVDRVRAALPGNGRVLDCGKDFAPALVRHVWHSVQQAKARRFHDEIDRLIHGLSALLDADLAVSAAGRSAERLAASVGPPDREAFDFEAMSRILRRTAPASTLPESRRARIESALTILREQRFFSNGDEGYTFCFTSPAAALSAYWTRHAPLTELVKAMRVARLEIDGLYQEDTHDTLLTSSLEPGAMAFFPGYLIEIDADRVDPIQYDALSDVLAAGLPLKVLVQTHDVLDASPLDPTHFGFGRRIHQLTNMALSLQDAYVLQAPVSHLFKRLDAVRRGLEYPGPALFSVYSGAGGCTGDLPAYLVAAAALSSRAFPAFTYDPCAGADLRSRFSLAGNPDANADWPVRRFVYERADHQAASSDEAFTFVDFVACDERYASHFARVDRAAWHDALIPVSEALALDHSAGHQRVPAIAIVDQTNRLGKAIVDEVVLHEARRCREMWRRLQASARQPYAPAELETPPEPAVQVADAVSTPAPEPVTSPAVERSTDDPFIETPRCSTCNECTQINDRMFAYNENKQAYIADPAAGTYRQLVEAAESCQVSIIHPGKPRDPNEPGLEELLARAEAFL